MALKKIPFDLETAKKIQAGDIAGKMYVSDDTHNKIRLICTDRKSALGKIIALEEDKLGTEWVVECNLKGEFLVTMPSSDQYATTRCIVLEVPDNEPQNFIDSESLFDKWGYIQGSLNKWFKEKALKNNVKISDNDLIHYAGEFFTWLRETRLIFNFQWNKLEELNKYAEEHIMDPSWSNKARHDIKQIFGIKISKHEFKPFDKVIVRNNDGCAWIVDIYSHPAINGKHWCIGGLCKYILPFEGNEHLLGTTDKPKEE